MKPEINDHNKIMRTGGAAEGPQWRSLTHTNPEVDAKQMVAGFLLYRYPPAFHCSGSYIMCVCLFFSELFGASLQAVNSHSMQRILLSSLLLSLRV
jgi:hypothetical protein